MVSHHNHFTVFCLMEPAVSESTLGDGIDYRVFISYLAILIDTCFDHGEYSFPTVDSQLASIKATEFQNEK